MLNSRDSHSTQPSSSRPTIATNYSTTLRSLVAGGFQLREHQVIARQQNPRHDHEYHCIGFLIGGLGTAEFGREQWDVRPGYINVIPAGVPHVERFGTPEIRWCGIELPIVRDEFAREAGCVFERPSQVRGGPANQLAARIYRELRVADDAATLSLHGLGLELLDALSGVRHCHGGSRPPWINRAEECVRSRFLDPPSLSEIATEVRIHPMHLAREFRRWFGVSVGEHVRNLRVDHAITLLVRDDWPLARIACVVGFSDQAHFTRLFLRRIGMTPGAYRLKFRRR